MSEKHFITPEELDAEFESLVQRIRQKCPGALYFFGVPRGGVPVALMLASRTFGKFVDSPEEADVIVDDIHDSGKTEEWYKSAYPDKPFFALFDKRMEPWGNRWLVMPWERTKENTDTSAEDIVTRLFQFIGEDPSREGLQETPRRFLNAWKEWAVGYDQNPKDILKCFEDGADGVNELVIVHNVPLISKCEHHLADIIGIAHVGYIPKGKIVGLSKLARLTECFARRLQVQERLTNQIADALVENLDPIGVGVLVRAAHHCMSTRGVRVHGSVTTTSAMRGALFNKPEARAEFLTLCQMAENGRTA